MGLPPKPRLASCLNPKGVRTPKRAADEAAPMLRQLRTKFIALNMALAALVLAASFATICYADYRADIDDVRNRLMAATSRSLHEPQLIPDAEPFHRGEAPREDGENAADADGTDDDDNRAGNEAAGGTDADNDAEGATSGNANPGKSVEGAFFSGGKAACYDMRHRCGIGSMCYPGLPCGCHRQKRRRSLPGLWPLGGRAGNGFDAGGRFCFNPWENAGKLSAYAPLGRPAGGGKKRWNVAGLFWRKCYWRQGFWYADHCGNDNWELPRRCVSLQRRWNGGQPHKL